MTHADRRTSSSSSSSSLAMAYYHKTLAIAMAICAAASSLSAAAAPDDDDYVALHNAARVAAGAGPVGWDREAARRAGERAAAACTSGGVSSAAGAGGYYGENVFRGAPGNKAWAAADAVRAWTAPAAREHAQVLWPGSTKVGCARAVCGGHGQSGVVVISCSYQPAVKEQLRGAPLPRECRFNISRCFNCPIC